MVQLCDEHLIHSCMSGLVLSDQLAYSFPLGNQFESN